MPNRRKMSVSCGCHFCVEDVDIYHLFKEKRGGENRGIGVSGLGIERRDRRDRGWIAERDRKGQELGVD